MELSKYFFTDKDGNSIDKEAVTTAFQNYFSSYVGRERTMKLFTGIGGMELLDESMEKSGGYERVYIGLKVPRILRRLSFSIKKNRRGMYYKTIKIVP